MVFEEAPSVDRVLTIDDDEVLILVNEGEPVPFGLSSEYLVFIRSKIFLVVIINSFLFKK